MTTDVLEVPEPKGNGPASITIARIFPSSNIALEASQESVAIIAVLPLGFNASRGECGMAPGSRVG